jgi:cytochrome P450
VFDEVRTVAGDQPIDAARVEGLAFCRQVIQEAMRLFPPGSPESRGSRRLRLKSATLQFPPGTRIHIPVFALHRNAGLWDNPDAFDPDRFAPGSGEGADHALPTCLSVAARVSASGVVLR